MEQQAVRESPAPGAQSFAPQPMRFTGSGSEYFGIWIVNLLLTIVTLGIYASWAKVRRLQYFYRHTEVAGSSFDFHGSAIKIFIGRMIALVMAFAYSFSLRMQSVLTVLLVLAALALVMPWLLRNSFRFRLYNTSWRGTRFHFRGSVAGAYRVFLLNGLLTLITLYLLAPFMHQRLKAYQHDNSWFGRTRCSFHASAGQFYLIYLLLVALAIGFLIVIGVTGGGAIFMSIAGARSRGGQVDPRQMLLFIGVLYAAIIVMAVSIAPAFRALITNLIWNNTRLGEHRIECRMSPWRLIWITASNMVLVILTLGLFMPWASVRLARFQLGALTLLPVSDLQEFVAAEPERLGAVGEEAATAFDFDIAL
jgi:uncharacterized membrane protein YjgN (DUF898 family)